MFYFSFFPYNLNKQLQAQPQCSFLNFSSIFLFINRNMYLSILEHQVKIVNKSDALQSKQKFIQ